VNQAAVFRSFLYAALFVALWWWLATLARGFDHALGGPLPAWLRALAPELIGAGAILAFLCVVSFGLYGRGTPAPFDPPRDFVAAGPYRFVRNPMYIGALLTLIGAALWLQSPGILALAAAGLLAAHLLVVLVEEPSLEKRFGDSYREYRSNVRRWLPRRPGTPSGERRDSVARQPAGRTPT